MALVFSLAQARPTVGGGLGAPPWFGSSNQTFRMPGAGGAPLDQELQSMRIWLYHRALDSAPRSRSNRRTLRDRHESAVSESVASVARHHAANSAAGAARAQQCGHRRVAAPRVARHQKKVACRHATLVFTDESGFLLLPLVRRTLAPRGHAAPLRHRGRHRDKISVAAALTLSPVQGHVSLYYHTYPNRYVNGDVYTEFLRGLIHQVHNPLVVIHDRGNMHFGDPIRQLQKDFPHDRLDLNLLPPYAPELNPVEHLWNFSKDKELSNFTPHTVGELNATATDLFETIRHDQSRLRTFFNAVPLSWNPLTVFL
jgi:transposase